MDITMVGGMASFTLNYDPDTKTTSFTDSKAYSIDYVV